MLIHVRQAGDVDSQHMASRTLARVRAAGSSLRRATVVGIAQRASGEYAVDIECDGAHETLTSELLVNAAGPFAGAVADILGV